MYERLIARVRGASIVCGVIVTNGLRVRTSQRYRIFALHKETIPELLRQPCMLLNISISTQLSPYVCHLHFARRDHNYVR